MFDWLECEWRALYGLLPRKLLKATRNDHLTAQKLG